MNCKRILSGLLALLGLFSSSLAATRAVVPNADGEGSIGVTTNAWGAGYFKSGLYVNGVPVVTNVGVASQTPWLTDIDGSGLILSNVVLRGDGAGITNLPAPLIAPGTGITASTNAGIVTINSTSVGGGASEDTTNYLRNAANLTNISASALVTNNQPVVVFGTISGNGSNVTSVNAATLNGYTADQLANQGATYFLTTNLISYGAVTGRMASLSVPADTQVATYNGPIASGQYLATYLIASNEMPAVLEVGTYTFTFFGWHTSIPGKNPTIRGDLYVVDASTGLTNQEFESATPVVVPAVSNYFSISVPVTNAVPRDGFAFVLRTKIVDDDGYTGDYQSFFGKPYYPNFKLSSSAGIYASQADLNAHRNAAGTNVHGLGTASTNMTGDFLTPSATNAIGGLIATQQFQVAAIANVSNTASTALQPAATNGMVTNYSNAYLNGVGITNLPLNSGFEDPYNAGSMAFSNATRSWYYFTGGTNVRYTIAGKQWFSATNMIVQIPDVEGLHYLYFRASDGMITNSQTEWTIVNGEAQISMVYWDKVNSQCLYLGDERHGKDMSSVSHASHHFLEGAQWWNVPGQGALIHNAQANIATQPGATGSNTCCSIQGSTIWDDDHTNATAGLGSRTIITSSNDAASFGIMYATGAVATVAWRTNGITPYPFMIDPSNTRPMYNALTAGVWSTNVVSEDNYFISWIVQVPRYNDGVGSGFVLIPDSFQSSSLTGVQARTYANILENRTVGITEEMKPLYRIINYYNATVPNAYPATVKYTKIVDVQDLRSGNNNPASATSGSQIDTSVFALTDASRPFTGEIQVQAGINLAGTSITNGSHVGNGNGLTNLNLGNATGALTTTSIIQTSASASNSFAAGTNVFTGRVGIGNTTPTTALTIGATNLTIINQAITLNGSSINSGSNAFGTIYFNNRHIDGVVYGAAAIQSRWNVDNNGAALEFYTGRDSGGGNGNTNLSMRISSQGVISGNGSGLTNITQLSTPLCCINANTNMVLAAGIATILPITNIVVDTHGGYNTNTYEYTLPQAFPGYYEVSGHISITDAAPTYISAIIYNVTQTGATNIVDVAQINPTSTYGTANCAGGIIAYTGGVYKLRFGARVGGLNGTVAGMADNTSPASLSVRRTSATYKFLRPL